MSILGCEQVGLGYYKAKARQEELVRKSPVGWSLLRATQFHELIDGAFSASARFGMLPGGSAPLQPIAAETAAAELASIALGKPLNDSRQIAGPERHALGGLAREWKRATGRRGAVVPIPLIGRTGRALAAGAFTLPSDEGPWRTDGGRPHEGQGPDFSAWLDRHYGSSGE